MTDSNNKRLVSLDQFRGFTVLGMFLVNYFSGYIACPTVFRHTHDYCSYADVIMPQFLFAVGFALRLTFGRRMQQSGNWSAYGRVAKRLLGLILVALVVYSVSARAPNWEALKEIGLWGAIKEPLKRQWFQTLTHIAVTSLWILPVIHAKPSIRIAWMLVSALTHIGLSYGFNFIWTNSPPNAIDGGPLGFLTWTIPAILGSLACDWFVPNLTSKVTSRDSDSSGDTKESRPMSDHSPRRGMWLSLCWGTAFMLLGYVLSCGTRWYDVAPVMTSPVAALETEQEITSISSPVATATNIETIDGKIASYPVFPPRSQIAFKKNSKDWVDWLAEPPFVKPPDVNERKWNYWMMSQRAGTLSYLTFAGGFSLVLFAVFFGVCDLWGLQFGLFRTFGTNALAAYVLHDLVSEAVQPFFPKDSPAWYALIGLSLFFFINWLFIRSLEKQGIFLRV